MASFTCGQVVKIRTSTKLVSTRNYYLILKLRKDWENQLINHKISIRWKIETDANRGINY